MIVINNNITKYNMSIDEDELIHRLDSIFDQSNNFFISRDFSFFSFFLRVISFWLILSRLHLQEMSVKSIQGWNWYIFINFE